MLNEELFHCDYFEGVEPSQFGTMQHEESLDHCSAQFLPLPYQT